MLRPVNHVHLDFHTSEQIDDIGKDFDALEFINTLKTIDVDSVTTFAKCHHGNLYYYTDLPEQHPFLEKNLLLEQYQITQANNIQMPVYISVGFDERQAYEHPEWIAIDTSGRQIKEFGDQPFDSGWHWLCLNNGYQQKIVEVINDVIQRIGAVDGFFFDIVTQPECCCPNCKKAMLAAGMDPTAASERYRFARQVEANFKELVYQTIRSQLPQATVFFNGLVWQHLTELSIPNYTHLEVESLASGIWGYEHYPLLIKYLQNGPLDTIAMTARFHKSWADFGGYKNPAALEYEVVRSILSGSTISIGDQLHPNGKLDNKAYELMAAPFTLVKKYWQTTRTSRDVCDIAIYLDNRYEDSNLFSAAVAGAAKIMQESHLLYDIIDASADLSNYKLVIFPDHIHADENLAAKIAAYKAVGGKILASYQSLNESTHLLPLADIKPSNFEQDYVDISATHYICYQAGMLASPALGADCQHPIWEPYFNRSYRHFSSHFQTPEKAANGYFDWLADDASVYLAHAYFSLYYRNGNHIYKECVQQAVRQLITPTLAVVGLPTTAALGLRQAAQAEACIITLTNYVPLKKGDVYTIEDIPVLHDVQISFNDRTIRGVDVVDAQTQATFDGDQLQLDNIHGHALVTVFFNS
ncbi:alpha-amylase family protein [Culicoidibacter larvae]|nr:alpha-amylase family protein [Culicoidibacter larvae]